MTQQVFEGTWEEVREEIRALEHELMGHQVRIVLEHEKAGAEPLENPHTLADLFVGRTGGIHSGGAERLSERTGAKFTDYVVQKRQEGRL